MSELNGLESTIVRQASDDLRRLSTMFQGILKIAPVLDQVVSLQQAAEESEGRVTVARAEELALKDSIDAKRAEMIVLMDRTVAAGVRADNAEKEAGERVNTLCAEIMQQARTTAAGLVAKATDRADGRIAAGELQANEMLARATAQVDEKNIELTATIAALETAKAELASATAAWEAFRATVAK